MPPTMGGGQPPGMMQMGGPRGGPMGMRMVRLLLLVAGAVLLPLLTCPPSTAAAYARGDAGPDDAAGGDDAPDVARPQRYI